MPKYPWLFENSLDTGHTQRKMTIMKRLGVPYSDEEIAAGLTNLTQQSTKIAENLMQQGVAPESKVQDKEIVALIAYLQRLGTDIK